MDNGKSKRITKKIKVYGIVQGVGFRPLVYRIAKKLNATGTVQNIGGYVEIILQTTQEAYEEFMKELKSGNSGEYEIVKLETEDLETKDFETKDFETKDFETEDFETKDFETKELETKELETEELETKEFETEELETKEIETEEIDARKNDARKNDVGKNDVGKNDTVKRQNIEYNDFIILGSGESEKISIIPPDLPICPECRKELYSENNRRYFNPFISCMTCGPRYTIIEEMPYDRDRTSMVDFEMCDFCREEYISPEDRRFHAQTISCNDCGPYLIFQDNKVINKIKVLNQETTREESKEVIRDGTREDGKEVIQIGVGDKEIPIHDYYKEHEALEKAVSILKSGGIIAVKGIGGYHLVCSPFREETVQNLRKLKGREEKPFAVMFENMALIKDYCLVSEEEEALLTTKARPIVLLYMLMNTMAPATNKGSIYCGAFLPYTPLQLLLTKQCGPLVMTSANLSDKPIIRDDEVMLSLHSSYLDGVLYNKRRIVRSVDDSVAKIIDGKPQLIRRSRGYVPYPVFINHIKNHKMNSSGNSLCTSSLSFSHLRSTDFENVSVIDKNLESTEILNNYSMIFAAGGDLKAAFCLYSSGSAVVSQHFGDLEEVAMMEEYKKSYADLSGLLKIKPDLAVCDMHPNYYSSEFAKSLGIPYLQVQHHHAHIASVIAEHDLQGKVIGVALDGTGYGTDGNIWGGEFLICENAEFIRAGQLKYTTMLGGDESMRDAKKTATCFLIGAGLEEYVMDNRKDIIKAALEHKINTVLTSSMGRLFDAVASILDIRHINHYEGECAVFLEREAVLAEREGKNAIELSFAFGEECEIIRLDPKPIIEDMCRLREKSDTGALALGFHYALAEAISWVCVKLKDKYRSNIVALSGGVFQNTVLSQRTLKILRREGFEIYVNLAVPPNDGAISLGQAYIGLQKDYSNYRQ